MKPTYMMGTYNVVIAISCQREVTLLASYCPLNHSMTTIIIPIATLYITAAANDRVCPSTVHTQVKPEDVEAFQDHCGWNPLVC